MRTTTCASSHNKLWYNIQMDALSQDLLAAVRRLLTSSFSPIDFKYEWLTTQERACISELQFAQLTEWILAVPADAR